MWRFGILGLAGIGCTKDVDDPQGQVPCGGAPAALTVGTGTDSFLPIETGDPLTMVHGPQGGWHVDVGGQVEALGGDVTVHATLTVPDLDDLEIAGDQSPAFIALAGHDPESCEGTFYGVRFFLDVDMDLVCALGGRRGLYEVVVTDLVTDRTVTAVQEVVIALDPNDTADCSG